VVSDIILLCMNYEAIVILFGLPRVAIPSFSWPEGRGKVRMMVVAEQGALFIVER
jgi:hypothetical protein